MISNTLIILHNLNHIYKSNSLDYPPANSSSPMPTTPQPILIYTHIEQTMRNTLYVISVLIYSINLLLN